MDLKTEPKFHSHKGWGTGFQNKLITPIKEEIQKFVCVRKENFSSPLLESLTGQEKQRQNNKGKSIPI